MLYRNVDIGFTISIDLVRTFVKYSMEMLNMNTCKTIVTLVRAANVEANCLHQML